MDEGKNQLFLKQYNSYFVTYELPPGIYTTKDISEAVYTKVDDKGTLETEYDDITMKTKLILTRFGLIIGTLKFNEKSFPKTLLGFTPYWDYKPNNAIHADSPVVYTIEKNLKFKYKTQIPLEL